MRLVALILIYLCANIATAAPSGAIRSVDIGEVGDHLNLSSHLAYRVAGENPPEPGVIPGLVDQADWQFSDEATPNLGLAQPPHWFALRLDNDSTSTWNGILDMSYSMIDVLNVYFVTPNGVEPGAQMGDQRPFANRPLAHRNFLQPLSLEAGASVVVVLYSASEGGLEMPLDLWRLPAFFEQDQSALSAQMIFVGIMLALTIYNFFLLFATRDWNYIWYLLCITSISFVVLSFHGVLAQFAWPKQPSLNNSVLVAAISLNIFAASIFAYSFLNLRRFKQWVAILFFGHAAVGVILFLLNLVLPYSTTIKLAAGLSVSGSLTAIFTGCYLSFKGEVLARLYVSAWFLLLAGSIAITLTHLGILPSIAVFTYGQQIGAVAEGLLLSFALAYRMNLERKRRYMAQQELLQHQQRANIELEKNVQERTRELQEANIKLTEASATDGLTQIKNRYFFDDTLLQEWQKNGRTENKISLLLIDGDHFKSINDTYGHLAGDAVLKHLATTFKQFVRRAGDFVARYGGEEFAILLCHTNLEGAASVAEKIRSEVASSPVIWEGNSISVTVSIGVACRLPAPSDQPSLLIEDADQALYRAKHQGRNRVMVYGTDGAR